MQKTKEGTEKLKCPWDEMKKGEIGSKQTHPVTGMKYLVNLTPEDNRRFLTPLAA